MAKPAAHTSINLVPDSKQQHLRALAMRRLFMTVAFIVMAVAIGIPLLLLLFKGSQKLMLNRVQSQIDERKTTISETPNITTILTVKDHLAALPALYQQRALASKLLKIIPSVMPTEVRLTNLQIGDTGSISFQGAATTYNGVEKFYQALVNGGHKPDPNSAETGTRAKPFRDVVVTQVSGPSGDQVTFSITATFDTALLAPAAGVTP